MASASYRPDDARITLAGLEFLRTDDGARLRRAVADLPDGGTELTVSQVAALRKDFPAAPLHAALALAKLQAKAAGPRGKFPEMTYVWATPEALEQATHIAVGRYKAERFAAFGATQVFDLCAGIGGDALAFAERMPVIAVELSPIRAACLRFNAQDVRPPLAHPLEVRLEDAANMAESLPAGAWIHIDPARRSEGKRSVQYEDLMPGPQVLQRLFAGQRPGAVKLSSAVDFASLPPLGARGRGHVELISHQGVVVQALWWIGTSHLPEERTATVLTPNAAPWSLTARPGQVDTVEVELGSRPRRLYELDGAITRAGLAPVVAQTLGLQPLTMDGGYLLGEGSTAASTPLGHGDWRHALTPFDVRTLVPFGRVLEALADLPAGPPGPVEVKARGNLPGIDTDDLQRKWSKFHGRACTVLLFRQHKETLAAVGFRARPDSVPVQPGSQLAE